MYFKSKKEVENEYQEELDSLFKEQIVPKNNHIILSQELSTLTKNINKSIFKDKVYKFKKNLSKWVGFKKEKTYKRVSTHGMFETTTYKQIYIGIPNILILNLTYKIIKIKEPFIYSQHSTLLIW